MSYPAFNETIGSIERSASKPRGLDLSLSQAGSDGIRYAPHLGRSSTRLAQHRAARAAADVGTMSAVDIVANMTPAQRQAVQAKLDAENRAKAEAERRAAVDRAAAAAQRRTLEAALAERRRREAAAAEEAKRRNIKAGWSRAVASLNARIAPPARSASVFDKAAAKLRARRQENQKGI